MSIGPAHLTGLEELADELERWSAFAHGALEDARVRHRHVRERVRRAERASALADDSLLADRAAVSELDDLLQRLDGETTELVAAVAARRTRLSALLGEATRRLVALDAAAKENLHQQERAAARVSTTTRDEHRARTALRQALEMQRVAYQRAFRRGGRDAATFALGIAEQEARRAGEALAESKNDLNRLRAAHDRLAALDVTLATEIGDATEHLARLQAGEQALAEVMTMLADVRRARQRTGAALERSATATDQMRADVAAAIEHLAAADATELGASRTYEGVQRLTIDAGRELRDMLTGEGESHRPIQGAGDG